MHASSFALLPAGNHTEELIHSCLFLLSIWARTADNVEESCHASIQREPFLANELGNAKVGGGAPYYNCQQAGALLAYRSITLSLRAQSCSTSVRARWIERMLSKRMWSDHFYSFKHYKEKNVRCWRTGQEQVVEGCIAEETSAEDLVKALFHRVAKSFSLTSSAPAWCSN